MLLVNLTFLHVISHANHASSFGFYCFFGCMINSNQIQSQLNLNRINTKWIERERASMARTAQPAITPTRAKPISRPTLSAHTPPPGPTPRRPNARRRGLHPARRARAGRTADKQGPLVSLPFLLLHRTKRGGPEPERRCARPHLAEPDLLLARQVEARGRIGMRPTASAVRAPDHAPCVTLSGAEREGDEGECREMAPPGDSTFARRIRLHTGPNRNPRPL